MERIVFLDRDGVINVDSSEYIKNESEFEFIPNSPEAIALLTQNGFNVIVITNQSLVGRKMVSPKTLDAIFKKMKDGVKKAGGDIKDIFYCPHTPTDNCSCRKPSPGLILKAQKKYQIDLNQSFMVGDSAKDIECSRNAGCSKALLVKTGNGLAAQQQLFQKGIIPDFIGTDLYEAALWIINSVKS
ncbi:MAG: D-glycero-beta-D-manno-heptose 1,7-bisphosphate 7-phosphatase [Deltaproteobacteria bacterium]|uniref:D-glycero-beta-D-manno-heptose 1,7-bisphosphate 7-phosphatase n=1 Tax=Desulfobacula sp. TaxID=2593537 RepID=UPI0019AE4A7A|nr:D-glycero-beta-D-manno-heptose 1,7-bisphosphate 7-phosphatase [Candidatus Desulfobacula maris]MBL6994461.1 D-glycero-beta-D-manno-heptose 1,7-bisphosphate 7-phosphatase [Desulfobacula sp.]